MDHRNEGLDWASEARAICIVESTGRVRKSVRVALSRARSASSCAAPLLRYPGQRRAMEPFPP
jgi:hypothetical protein